jgi:hypothetical protein
MSRDKDVRTCLHNVLTVVPPSHIHFVQVSIPRCWHGVSYYVVCVPQSKNFRAISRDELSVLFREETGGAEMTALSATGEYPVQGVLRSWINRRKPPAVYMCFKDTTQSSCSRDSF